MLIASRLIMVVRIELVFFSFFYHHPFIAEKVATLTALL